jgi:hypothetical protein
LLAYGQQRQSPVLSPFFGLSTFLLDGLKLFAKHVFDTESRLLYSVWITGAIFAVEYLKMSLILCSNGDTIILACGLGGIFVLGYLK